MCYVLLLPAHCAYPCFPGPLSYTDCSEQNGLGTYQKRIHIVMVLIATSFVAVMMTVFLACRPYRHYWQISPDPGNSCQPAISKPIIWVSFVLNVSTDIFLFSIPIPMLWKSSLQFYKKVAATSVLSAGLLTIICATLKSIYVIVVSRVPSSVSWLLLRLARPACPCMVSLSQTKY